MRKFIKNIVIRIIYILFIPITICTLGFIFTPSDYKWYRKFIGGIWYCYFPKMYPYMTFYTQDPGSIYSHEIVEDIEDYNTYNPDLIDDLK